MEQIQDINKLVVVAQFSADVTLNTMKFASRAMPLSVVSHRLLWLRGWQADNKAKWQLATAAYMGGSLLGISLDAILVEDKNKKKALPTSTKKVEQRSTPYYRRDIHGCLGPQYGDPCLHLEFLSLLPNCFRVFPPAKNVDKCQQMRQAIQHLLDIAAIERVPEDQAAPPAKSISSVQQSLHIGIAPRVIKVYSEDETSRAFEIPSDITSRDLCQLLILKNHYVDDHSWTLFERLTYLGLERIVEDHEMIVEVHSKWGIEEDNKFYFRKNYAKYEFFKAPEIFFPDHLVSLSNESNGTTNHAQILQMFLSSTAYPEIHGYLHFKEQGKKTWKKMYFLLRRSGLYFSTKGTSKEPRHLQLFSEFSCSDIYMSLRGKKISGVPATFGFCFKPYKAGGTRDLKYLYADSEQSRTCWMTAIRLLKDFCITIVIGKLVFLVRDSQSNPKTFVLSLSHGLKIKHFQIVPLEEEGKLFYTLDDGHTRFSDLIQLVEFYQLNKGILPCKLKHYCARIAL
ncbi:PREDICTED: growth factor receptor-bound protein 14-like [Thamnophis sirtalis]|uniref:Growth factor receptor-bound protein 14-like n=1 Tax=Thamnophis sirtalis TaxID=35019 RepID=A0A6I9YX19_9SAUR|nr:PREDICTED: growth factor receptor-bound protein 14-like [Thamnophis sirtalis]